MSELIITFEERKRSNIEGIIDDAIRFGCAIGSWAKSDIPWHKYVALKCIEEMSEGACREVYSIFTEKEKKKE